MSTGKQTCPTCHQSVNKRTVRLGKHHVQALLKIGLYIRKNGVKSARMVEIRPILSSIQYSTLNQWRHLEPEMVFGKRGVYDFDTDKMHAAFAGGKICIEYQHDPLAGTTERTAFGTMSEAKGVAEFLDEQQQYVAEYVGKATL